MGDQAEQHKKILNRHGMTMVEMIVTFAILVMFLTAAVAMMPSALRIYGRMKAASRAQTVSNMILNKITGEMEGAWTAASNSEEESGGEQPLANTSTATLIIGQIPTDDTSDNNSCVCLYDNTGSRIYINKGYTGASEDYMVIHYYKVTTLIDSADGSKTEKVTYQPVDWTFDKSAYMGYKIDSLTFTGFSDEPTDPNYSTDYRKNVIRVDLQITNQQYGNTYKYYRYITCYNFYRSDEDNDFDKIEIGGNIPDDESESDTEKETTGSVPDIPQAGESNHELAKATAAFFESGWTAYQTVDKDTKENIIIYYKVVNGQMFIYDFNHTVDKTILDKLRDQYASKGKYYEMNDYYYSNTDAGVALLKALADENGTSFNTSYNGFQLIFDEKTRGLMGIVYKVGNKKYGVLYEGYTIKNVQELDCWSQVDGASWSEYQG